MLDRSDIELLKAYAENIITKYDIDTYLLDSDLYYMLYSPTFMVVNALNSISADDVDKKKFTYINSLNNLLELYEVSEEDYKDISGLIENTMNKLYNV